MRTLPKGVYAGNRKGAAGGSRYEHPSYTSSRGGPRTVAEPSGVRGQTEGEVCPVKNGASYGA